MPPASGSHTDSTGRSQGFVWHSEVTGKIEYMVPLSHIKVIWAMLELRDTKFLISPLARNCILWHVLGNYKSLRGHQCHMYNTPRWHHCKVAESHFVDESFLITTATAAWSVTLCMGVSLTHFKVAKWFFKKCKLILVYLRHFLRTITECHRVP